jgi:ribonuclease HII
MPWVVGIDEAGYGPNLGPLVQAAVALRLPDGDVAGWETLRPVVRRCCDKADGRLLIDDSKKVYTRHGLAALERGVLTLAPWSCTLAELIRKAGLDAYRHELTTEMWCDFSESLPITADPQTRLDEWHLGYGLEVPLEYTAANVRLGSMVAGVVPTPRFNRICDESGSKATVLSRGMVEIITQVREELGVGELASERVLVLCDKMGGRNFYAGMLQEAFPTGWVIPERESAAESRYRIDLLDRPVTVVFRPRADGDSVAVALASMLCKYLREVCMRQFNRFWAAHVPGIVPTAGYPVDAKRFFEQIKPAMAKLGLTDDQVWRKK